MLLDYRWSSSYIHSFSNCPKIWLHRLAMRILISIAIITRGLWICISITMKVAAVLQGFIQNSFWVHLEMTGTIFVMCCFAKYVLYHWLTFFPLFALNSYWLSAVITSHSVHAVYNPYLARKNYAGTGERKNDCQTIYMERKTAKN